MSLTYETGHRASQGARTYQEDACVFVRLPPAAAAPSSPSQITIPMEFTRERVVAVLADGMGGHVGGERASTTACRGFVAALDGYVGQESAHLLDALAASNDAILREAQAEPGLHGMGCTLIGAVISESGLRWVSVGDSRLFLFRKGELYQLNEDHSLAPLLDQLAERGEMSRDEAHAHPRRHHLRSALTGEAIELIDHAGEDLTLYAGDCIVLASDGIDTLQPDQIADVIEGQSARGADALAGALIETVDAMARAGQDNTTVMAVLVSG